ncbi:MucBP domain-containing protein [Lactococcus garvieae]|uniref:MucBP domain-containing protein n=1 Tax=Lactococcus garvieae TaxID=1363 RepID=UPI00385415D6
MKRKRPFKHLFLVSLASAALIATSGTIHTIHANETAESRSTEQAEEGIINASGENGTVQWTLTNDGTLTLRGGTLGASIADGLLPCGDSYPDLVKKIILTDKTSLGSSVYLFAGLHEVETIEGLENLDISHRDSLEGMFAHTSKLKSLDLSNFDMRNVRKFTDMFTGDSSLKSLTLGANFTFPGECPEDFDIGLPVIEQTDEYTGYWQNLGLDGTPDHPRGLDTFTSKELLKNFDEEYLEGTFVWQPNTLYGGADLTAQTTAIGQADAMVNLKEKLEGPSGKEVAVTAKITDSSGAEVHNGHLKKGKYTVTYTGTTSIGQIATVTNVLIVTDPGAPVVKGGHITVQHVDTAGKSISSDAILKGNVGDAITPSQKSISGYTYKSTTWPDTTHKFTSKTQTVKMVYSKNTTPTPVTQSPISVYRLYNKKSMEHLYTKDAHEYNNLPKKSSDWVREGVNFKAYAKADSTTQAVYRVYNPKSGEHLFTTDSNEVKVLTTQHGWKNEGVAWHSPKAGKEVYRLFHPKAGLGAHFVTADANERKVLTTKPNEWKYEGIAWHSVK